MPGSETDIGEIGTELDGWLDVRLGVSGEDREDPAQDPASWSAS